MPPVAWSPAPHISAIMIIPWGASLDTLEVRNTAHDCYKQLNCLAGQEKPFIPVFLT